MALVLKDRVLETCTSPGTGTITLLGAVTGYQAFSTVGNGNTCYYAIADQNGANWEVGIGTYSSGTLARTTVLSSSNAGSLTNFSTGSQNVFLTYPSERSVNLSSAALTSGRVAYATTDGLLTDSANLVFNGTNLGIGTGVTPNKPLTIYKVSDDAEIRLQAGTNDLYLSARNSGGQFDIFNASNAGITFGTNNTERMRITSTGFVGIGTSSPLVTLHVSNSVTNTAGAGTELLQIANTRVNTSSSGAAISFVTNEISGSDQYKRAQITGEYDDASNLNGRLLFATTNTSGTLISRMRIDANGNVGIGTATATIGTRLVLATDDTTTTGQLRYARSADVTYYWETGRDNQVTGDFLFSNATGSTKTERMRITAAGNLGLGVTPSAWTTNYGIKSFDIVNGCLYGATADLNVVFNGYYNGTNFIYKVTDFATKYTQLSGQHQFFTAPSGTAGNAITFTQAMTLTASGNLGLGTTDPDYGSYGATERILGITGVATNRGRLSLQNTSTGSSGVAGTVAFFNGSTLLASLDVNADGATNKGLYAFNTNNGTSVSERMRITSAGNVGIGTTSPQANLQVTSSAFPVLKVADGLGGGAVALGDSTISSNYVGIWRGAANSISGGGFLNVQGNNIAFMSTDNVFGSATRTMTLDNGGNLLLGTTASNYRLNVKGGGTVGDSSVYAQFTTLDTGTTATDGLLIGLGVGSSPAAYFGQYENAPVIFLTNGTEKMRIDSSGNLLVGTTSQSTQTGRLEVHSGSASTAGMFKTTAGATAAWACDFWNADTTGNNLFVEFATETSYTARGSITYNRAGGLTVYNTTSDQRLKTNIINAPSALSKINSIQIRSFDWIETGNHIDFGVIAQELEQVAPETVTQGEDKEDGSIKRAWAVDTSVLVPAMIKAIQEQQALIESLTTRLTALENK